MQRQRGGTDAEVLGQRAVTDAAVYAATLRFLTSRSAPMSADSDQPSSPS